jgi:hypothetical protein
MTTPIAPRILDGHSHVASTRYMPPAFIEGVVDNVVEQMRAAPLQLPRAKILERMLEGYQDHDASTQLREMDALGIAKSVLLLPDFTYALPGSPLSIEQMYSEHARILAAHPDRFEVFAGIDPRWGQDGLRLFERGVERHGFKGLKLYPPCGYRPDSPLLAPYYEVCQDLGLPVLIHIGPTSPALSFEEAQPIYVDAPARRYQGVRFILAHAAVNWREQALQLCAYRPNVYLDLSGAQNQPVADLLAGPLAHKIIFGTDWPLNHHRSLNRKLIETVLRSAPSPQAAGLMLSGNLERLLSTARTGDRAGLPQ